MAQAPSDGPPSIPGTNLIVAPYSADIDLSLTGSVLYTELTSSHPQMANISSFIRSQTHRYFSGTRMMVAGWDRVAKSSGDPVSERTYDMASRTSG